MSDSGRSSRGLAVLAVLMIAAFVVPYTLLRGVESFLGPFLFWTLFGIAAIAAIVHVLRGWRV